MSAHSNWSPISYAGIHATNSPADDDALVATSLAARRGKRESSGSKKEMGVTMQSICSTPPRSSSAHVKCPAMTLRGLAGIVAVLQSSPWWQGM